MSNRVSETILLCEDQRQERLARAFLEKCGRETKAPQLRSIVASRTFQGGNDKWVLRELPKQLNECRLRSKNKAQTQFIVMIDADNQTVEERRRQLNERLTEAGHAPIDLTDQVSVVLIPRRHIETWLVCLLGENATEEEDCKKRIKDPAREDFRKAGETLHEWSRANALTAATCVESLRVAFSECRKLG